MLKNPAGPTPSDWLAGTSSPGGRVVRTVVGTSVPGVMLKKIGLRVLLLVNKVT